MFMPKEGERMSLFDVQSVIQIKKRSERNSCCMVQGTYRNTEPKDPHAHSGKMMYFSDPAFFHISSLAVIE